MSEFEKTLDTFKYDNTNSSETKRIDIGNSSSPHIINNNLDITELSVEQKYAYQKFVKGENLFIT